MRTVVLWSLAVVALLARASTGDEGESASASKAVPETGVACEQLAGFDRLMRAFVRDEALVGASLAVTKDGRLVYARGFGFADVERREPVQPDSLFRIASISKPITAVAVLQLVDQQRLGLDDSVCDILPAHPHLSRDPLSQGPLAQGEEMDPRWRQVTVRQLLQHRGGFDRDQSLDPMFRSRQIAASLGIEPPPKPTDIVSFMLGRPLDFDPGARYAYSNFGYCLLGRVIERVSGEDYESAVRRQLLEPLGIHDMRIGGTLLPQRVAGEVRYYTPGNEMGDAVMGSLPPGATGPAKVPHQYGAWCLESMDAHGGWIGSAIDLVRFASQVQRHEKAGLLSPDMYRAMIACPPGAAGHDAQGVPKESFYGFGWQVRPIRGDESSNTDDRNTDDRCSLWHQGALPGTSTLLVARHDGLCWAVLFNTTYTADRQRPAAKIDPLIHVAAQAVQRWPSCDLFEQLRLSKHAPEAGQ